MSQETNGEGLIASILNRNEAPESSSVQETEVEADNCLNCHLNGNTVKLKDGACPECGFVKPRS